MVGDGETRALCKGRGCASLFRFRRGPDSVLAGKELIKKREGVEQLRDVPKNIPDFFQNGEAKDKAYTNVRDLDVPQCQNARDFIFELWKIYEPFADKHFLSDAKNHFLQRFWEMYLTVTLIHHGYDIKRVSDEGPEFYISLKNKRIWVEAVAPGPGEGKDHVPEFEPGGEARSVPTEKILLRFTHALAEKRLKLIEAIEKGIITSGDSYLLAINCRGIPHAAYGNTMPYYIQALLPFGPLAVTFDTTTGNIVNSFYQYREVVSKLNGKDIPTTAFLDSKFIGISAVLNSAVDCVNHPDNLGEDFSMLHNPIADSCIDLSVFNWCKQYSLIDNELIIN
jgi:hypothetical protein